MAKAKAIIKRRPIGRPKGSMNKQTADQQKLQKELCDNEKLMPISELAFRMANESYETLKTIEYHFGVDDDKYYKASKNANECIKAALPYFATQSKQTVQLETETEESIEQKMAKLMSRKFKEDE